MSLDGDYEPDNIFARIIRGEIPAARIFEDNNVLAFMDAFPQSRGHALVISKTSRSRNILDTDPEVLSQVIVVAQAVAKAVRRALQPDGVKVIQFNGAAAGQSVFHLHFHIIPVWRTEPLSAHGADMADLAELQTLARQIGAAMD